MMIYIQGIWMMGHLKTANMTNTCLKIAVLADTALTKGPKSSFTLITCVPGNHLFNEVATI